MARQPIPSKLHLGTASWSSEDWAGEGKLYPAGTKPGQFLSLYAEKYGTVEADSTFYRAPSSALVNKWKRDVPETFRFAFKAPQTITHEKALKGCEKEFEHFLGTLQDLGPRLGFICFQFGYFNRKCACPTLGDFLDRVDAFFKTAPRPRGVGYAIEIRNPKWIGEPLLNALRGLGIAYVLTEQEWMPKITALWDQFGERLLTAKSFFYIRFLGERKRIEAMTKTWDKLVIDRTEETRAWVPILRKMTEREFDSWAYFNSHWAGYGPGSIDLLVRIWEEEVARIIGES